MRSVAASAASKAYRFHAIVLAVLAAAGAMLPACGGGSSAPPLDAGASSAQAASLDGSREGSSAVDATTGARTSPGADASTYASTDGSADADADATTVPQCSPEPAAFYVATGGADTNPCTFSQPCLTLEKAQEKMASSSTKTTYVRSGTYKRSQSYVFKDGESLLGYPCDVPHSATLDATGLAQGGAAFACTGCSNVTMANFTFVAAPTYNGGAWSDSNILLDTGTNVHVENNVFTGNLAAYDESDIYSFNGNGIYIRGNQFQSQASGEPISTPFTKAGTYDGLYITDNSFTGCQRWCVESQIQVTSSFSATNLHIDRNSFSAFQGPNDECAATPDHYVGAISAAGPPSMSAEWATGSTIWGNTFDVPSTTNDCIWGIEVGWTGTSVEYNTLPYLGVAMAVSGMPGTEIENNTLTLLTSGSHEPNCGGAGCAFVPDGGYNQSEWIGVNQVNGVDVTGCVSPFCALGHGAYGARPPITMPSAPYGGATH